MNMQCDLCKQPIEVRKPEDDGHACPGCFAARLAVKAVAMDDLDEREEFEADVRSADRAVAKLVSGLLTIGTPSVVVQVALLHHATAVAKVGEAPKPLHDLMSNQVEAINESAPH